MRKSINRYFTTFFVFPGDAPGAITLNVVWMEWKFNAYKLYPSIFNSFPVIWTRSAKNRLFHERQPTFLFPLETTLRLSRNNHVKCCMDGKRIRCLQIVMQNVPINLQQFPSYSNRKCKKSPFSRTAAHIFVSPGDDPAIITQYVARMESKFDACQTAGSMYLSIFNSVRVIRCLSQCVSPKIANFTTYWFPLVQSG